jgi:predicted nucleic acid-binding protein
LPSVEAKGRRRGQLKTTFVDTTLLISVVQGKDDIYEEALAVIDDPEREFVSSVYVQLETLPMATWLGHEDQVEAYEVIFANVSRWIPSSPELSQRALGFAGEYGLGAVDALHVAAAEAAEAELITAEKPTKPMLRVTSPTVTSIRADPRGTTSP